MGKMNKLSPSEVAETAGCAMVLVNMFVATPMLLILLYAVMVASDMPTWAWGLYWVFVPVQFLAAGLISASFAFKHKN